LVNDPAKFGTLQSGQIASLDPFVSDRMSRLFGMNLRDVVVILESPAATGATKAITKDSELHFRAGACQPNTPKGDRLIAHELAHVVQQRDGRGERERTRKELDRRFAEGLAVARPRRDADDDGLSAR